MTARARPLHALLVAVPIAMAPFFGCGARTTPAPLPRDAGVDVSDAATTTGPTDKIDLLFAIDNSASMGEKQAILRDAVPELLSRLLRPWCTSNRDPGAAPVAPDGSGACPAGTTREFAPIEDLHVAIVTSSLGSGGSPDVCLDTGPSSKNPIPGLQQFDRHNDDRGHLINRTRPSNPPMTAVPGVEDPIANAKPTGGPGGGFLAWLPSTQRNAGKPAPNVTPYTSAEALTADFQSLMGGVQEVGCGLEAQLESWYRFLVQPDPWNSLVPDTSASPPRVRLAGVDETVLAQRKDFLRPDSVVAVVLLTDEPDSWSDPLSVGGRGWIVRTTTFPGSPTGLMPRATSACERPRKPNDPWPPECASCGFAGYENDPNCQIPCGAGCAGYYVAGEDAISVRYTSDMRRRYGFDPQFPLERYVDGLRSARVPDREGEHPGGASTYVGTKGCANPLFSRDLPTDAREELCNLARGPRTPDQVFFAVIGGVPWQLLLQDPSKPDSSSFKTELTAADWTRIVGADPQNGLYDGIDPHMRESIGPRGGLPPISAGDTADPVHGREWDTTTAKTGLDLQFACTFPLAEPVDCSDPKNEPTCDCGRNAKGTYVASPACQPNPKDGGNPSLHARGTAYPTIRELGVAKALGAQAVVASICPRSMDAKDPDYGYRPMVRALVQKLRPMLVK